MAWWTRPRSQTLKQTWPLQPLFDIEVYYMNPVLTFKCSQHHLIAGEMEKLWDWAHMIEKP
ncbi:hypothetical protein ACHQM5_000841 [Ranunculus cassubicifolius]